MKTIEAKQMPLHEKLKYEFKTDVFRAFTSGMIIKKLRERDGIEIDTVDEALKKLYKSGYTDIFCVPTHIMCGIEYDKACRMIEKFNDKMKIRISRPLVTETSDYYNSHLPRNENRYKECNTTSVYACMRRPREK